MVCGGILLSMIYTKLSWSSHCCVNPDCEVTFHHFFSSFTTASRRNLVFDTTKQCL